MVKVEQLYTGCLSQAAYYIESEGEAAVVDPLRDPRPYVTLAKDRGAKIKYVLETHFHADFVSGHLDLAAASGAQIVYGPNAEPEFAAKITCDGEELHVGKATIVVLHTPGHTMESTTYLLKDEEGKAYCIFTGDTLFLGDVGRPDLAQMNANMTSEQLAGLLYRSLRTKIMPLGDDLHVYPAHGAGSACGKHMSSDTVDTLGNQKKKNYALREGMTESEFVSAVLDGLPPPPEYFEKNVKLNKSKPSDPFEEVLRRGMRVMSAEEVERAMGGEPKALVVDTRSIDAFSGGHIRGSVFCGRGGGMAPWMATAFPDLNRELVVVADSDEVVEEVVMRLTRTGFDNIRGYLKGGIDAWVSSGRALEKSLVISPEELAKRLDAKSGAVLVDVRKPGEVSRVRCPGALQLPLGKGNMEKVPKAEELFVFCAVGYRGLICCSGLYAEHGHRGQVYNVAGGMGAMEACEAMKKHLEY